MPMGLAPTLAPAGDESKFRSKSKLAFAVDTNFYALKIVHFLKAETSVVVSQKAKISTVCELKAIAFVDAPVVDSGKILLNVPKRLFTKDRDNKVSFHSSNERMEQITCFRPPAVCVSLAHETKNTELTQKPDYADVWLEGEVSKGRTSGETNRFTAENFAALFVLTPSRKTPIDSFIVSATDSPRPKAGGNGWAISFGAPDEIRATFSKNANNKAAFPWSEGPLVLSVFFEQSDKPGIFTLTYRCNGEEISKALISEAPSGEEFPLKISYPLNEFVLLKGPVYANRLKVEDYLQAKWLL